MEKRTTYSLNLQYVQEWSEIKQQIFIPTIQLIFCTFLPGNSDGDSETCNSIIISICLILYIDLHFETT